MWLRAKAPTLANFLAALVAEQTTRRHVQPSDRARSGARHVVSAVVAYTAEAREQGAAHAV